MKTAKRWKRDCHKDPAKLLCLNKQVFEGAVGKLDGLSSCLLLTKIVQVPGGPHFSCAHIAFKGHFTHLKDWTFYFPADVF